MNKIVRMKQVDEGRLLNSGSEHLEFKKEFRRPKQQVAFL